MTAASGSARRRNGYPTTPSRHAAPASGWQGGPVRDCRATSSSYGAGERDRWRTSCGADIAEAVRAQIAHGRYERSDLFGSGAAGRDIADVLATVDLPVQKQLHYDSATLLADRAGV